MGGGRPTALDSGGHPYRIWRQHFVWQVFNYLACNFAALLISFNSSLLSPAIFISLIMVVLILHTAYRNLLERFAVSAHG